MPGTTPSEADLASPIKPMRRASTTISSSDPDVGTPAAQRSAGPLIAAMAASAVTAKLGRAGRHNMRISLSGSAAGIQIAFQWRLYVASSSGAFTWQVPVTPLRGKFQ
jgi:hypothetical protein